jgi:nitrous oxidase accessory protein
LLLICVIMLASCNQIATSESKTWTVDDDGPADFQRIQEALDAANAGDTVFVHNGTYYEHLTIGKSLTLVGEHRQAAVIDGSLSGNVIRITASSVRISGFTIRNGDEGVSIQLSNGHTISQNNIISNLLDGLAIEDSQGDFIVGNMVSSNDWHGVYMSNASDTVLQNNTIASNKIHGVSIENSHNDTVSGNTLNNNTYTGIMLAECNNISVVGNTISENKYAGVDVFDAANSIFYHNNFLSNAKQASTDGSAYTWESDYEGNYWSNYYGTDLFRGPGQNEVGSDGIGDAPHYIDTNNQDRYPLKAPIYSFDAGTSNGVSHYVNIISNSTVSNFYINEAEKTLRFRVAGEAGLGFCRVSLPNSLVQNLWQNKYGVLVDGQDPLSMSGWQDGKNAYVYFTYLHSEHEIVIKTSNEALFVISVISPENKTYSEGDVPLIFVTSDSALWMGYSLDRQTNVTISGNMTIADLPNGAHSVIVYANNTSGGVGASEMIYFSVETTQPESQRVEPFPLWILAAIAALAVFGATIAYFRVRKKRIGERKPAITRTGRTERRLRRLKYSLGQESEL